MAKKARNGLDIRGVASSPVPGHLSADSKYCDSLRECMVPERRYITRRKVRFTSFSYRQVRFHQTIAPVGYDRQRPRWDEMAIEPSPGRLKYLDTLSRYFLCSICSKVCHHFGCISTRPSFHLVCYPLHRTSGSLFASDITRDTASSCGTSLVKTFDYLWLSSFVRICWRSSKNIHQIKGTELWRQSRFNISNRFKNRIFVWFLPQI